MNDKLFVRFVILMVIVSLVWGVSKMFQTDKTPSQNKRQTSQNDQNAQTALQRFEETRIQGLLYYYAKDSQEGKMKVVFLSK